MKKLLTLLLGRIKKFPAKLTQESRLLSLIEALHPVSADKPLIRLGSKGDGGYLVPDDLAGISACFSPGVSDESGFEKDCADLGMQVFLADKSVEAPAAQHVAFSFTKKYIGAFSSDDFITLDEWVNHSAVSKNTDLLLQIDVEGYEYEVFLSASDALMKRFRIIVAEFHELEQLRGKSFFNIASRAFLKILQTHHCVHIHPNNCCGSLRTGKIEIPRVMEFTFVRKDRISGMFKRRDFPHPLDCRNTANDDLILPPCWYSR